RRHWWRVAKQLEKGMQVRINTLLLDKFALIFKLRRCQSHGRELQQKYDMRGQLWHNASLVWEDQSKLKRILEIIYKVSTHRLKQELQRCHNHGAMLEYWRDQIYDRYIKWKNKTHDDQQLILNLRGQILHLQNNPPINNPNMADDRRLPVLKLIQPALASFPPYIGQEPPDDYLDKVVQSWAFAEGHMTVLENAHAGDFDDAVKCTILKSKMAGKYAPVPANDPFTHNNPAINSPATLRAWARTKYQRETVGTKQSAIQRLTQERFQPFDTPDTYETRIRPLLLGVADDDAQVLGFLKSQLPGELFTWMRSDAPAGIDEFFIALKNMWLERTPNLYGGSNFNQVSAINVPPTISQLETNSHQLQNKSQSDNDSIRAEIKSMIKSELAVVPTTSLQPTQFQKTQALQSRQKQSDPIDYPRVPDKYMPERPPDGYGVYSEKNIHANLINPTPTSNQVIESVAKDVYEKVMDKISSFLPKKKNNTPNNDDMDEITK
ncbi:3485_t:CDS:1, partial [Entrophospora sp. SA101]